MISLTAIVDEPQRGIHIIILDNSDNEEAFSLERKVEYGSYSLIKNLSANSTEYTDWGLEKSKKYTYRIQAFNEFGNSDWVEKSQYAAGEQNGKVYIKTNSDTYVEESNPNSNYANRSYMSLAGLSGYWGGKSNILLKFSLSAIPDYSNKVKTAKLQICEAGGGHTSYPGAIQIYATSISEVWLEEEVTWNNIPAISLSNSTAGTSHDPNNSTCVTINVTNIVNGWFSTEIQNYGIMLASDSNSYCSYYTKEGYSSGSAQLEVIYSW
ncbi:MAG: DNRLRE domain-containing protein [Candidatus Cloacimonetes bacterium]|nr:DNRLRE domain-containing protein [Candidatus Cloacimonadota bacterium]